VLVMAGVCYLLAWLALTCKPGPRVRRNSRAGVPQRRRSWPAAPGPWAARRESERWDNFGTVRSWPWVLSN